MKKITMITGMLVLLLHAAHAQFQKGDQTLGVGLEFYSNGSNYNSQSINPTAFYNSTSTLTSFSTEINYSHFIAPRLDVGVSFGFGTGITHYTDHTNNVLTSQDDKNYDGSIYLRKYFIHNNKIGVRVGPYFSYQYINTSYIDNPDNNQINSFFNGKSYHTGLIADFVYYPTNKLGLAVNLGSLSYANATTNQTQQSSSANGLNLNLLNSNLRLSAYYVFGR